MKKSEIMKIALKNYDIYRHLRDSIFKKESEHEISQVQMKFESERKEQELVFMEKKNKTFDLRDKATTTIFFIFIFSCFCRGCHLFLHSCIANLFIKKRATEKLMEANLKLLKNNPFEKNVKGDSPKNEPLNKRYCKSN